MFEKAKEIVDQVKIEASDIFGKGLRAVGLAEGLTLKERIELLKDHAQHCYAMGVKIDTSRSHPVLAKAFTKAYFATAEKMKTHSLVWNLETGVRDWFPRNEAEAHKEQASCIVYTLEGRAKLPKEGKSITLDEMKKLSEEFLKSNFQSRLQPNT